MECEPLQSEDYWEFPLSKCMGNDHNENRHVMGQDNVQFGLATSKGFLPIGTQIHQRKTKIINRIKGFKDRRSALAKSYRVAQTNNKHDILEYLLKRALSIGIRSSYLIGDAWFGTTRNICLAIGNGLTAIFMMRRNRTCYQYNGQIYTLKGVYRHLRKTGKVTRYKGFSYFSVTADYNLSGDKKNPEWMQVKLIFSKVSKIPKDSWVVLLCTDDLLEDEKIFEIYGLRWSIEVYFKEIKQHFGYLKEQSGRYEVHYASIHLAAIRHVLLYALYLNQNTESFSAIRKQFGFQSELFSFTCLGWEIIQKLVNQTIDEVCSHLEVDFTEKLKEAIDDKVNTFLIHALQLNPKSTLSRLKAEKMGLLNCQ